MVQKLDQSYNRGYTDTSETLSSGLVRRKTYYDSCTRYIDTEFHEKVALGAPLLRMPYSRSKGRSFYGTRVSVSNGKEYPTSFQASANVTRSMVETMAAANFYENASKEQYMDLGVSLAEMPETIALVASTAKRLAGAYRSLRKLDIHGAFTALGIRSSSKTHIIDARGKTVLAKEHKKRLYRRARNTNDVTRFAAESWLELRYGWTPLVLDVYSAAEAAAVLLNRWSEDVVVYGKARVKKMVEPASSGSSAKGYIMIQARYDAGFKITNKGIRNVSALGLTNPATIAWELVPFSFVADWFIPIGNYLQSFSVLQGLTLQRCTKTIFERRYYSCSQVANSSFMPGVPTLDEWYYMQRSVLTTVPSRALPSFQFLDKINGNRALDAISLMRLVFSNK